MFKVHLITLSILKCRFLRRHNGRKKIVKLAFNRTVKFVLARTVLLSLSLADILGLHRKGIVH